MGKLVKLTLLLLSDGKLEGETKIRVMGITCPGTDYCFRLV